MYESTVQELTTPIIVTVSDPCDSPTRVTASTLSNQEYTITQETSNYTIPAFVSDPDFCQIEYSFIISDALVENTLTFDPETLTFYFFEPSDLLVSGDNFN